jgi:hypothetical protein
VTAPWQPSSLLAVGEKNSIKDIQIAPAQATPHCTSW